MWHASRAGLPKVGRGEDPPTGVAMELGEISHDDSVSQDVMEEEDIASPRHESRPDTDIDYGTDVSEGYSSTEEDGSTSHDAKAGVAINATDSVGNPAALPHRPSSVAEGLRPLFASVRSVEKLTRHSAKRSSSKPVEIAKLKSELLRWFLETLDKGSLDPSIPNKDRMADDDLMATLSLVMTTIVKYVSDSTFHEQLREMGWNGLAFMVPVNVDKLSRLVTPHLRDVRSIRRSTNFESGYNVSEVGTSSSDTGLERRRHALVLVNVQNDFFERGSSQIYGADSKYVKKLNEIRNLVDWDLVIFVTTEHPSNHHSFVANNPGSAHKKFVRMGDDEVQVVHEYCVRGTWGAELHPELERSSEDVVLATGRDPRRSDVSWLRDEFCGGTQIMIDTRITDVFIAGLPYDGSVKEAAIHVHDHELSLDVHVMTDACICSQGSGDGVTDFLGQVGVNTIKVNDVQNFILRSRGHTGADESNLEQLSSLREQALKYAAGDAAFEQSALSLLSLEGNAAIQALASRGKSGKTMLHAVCSIRHVNAVDLCRKILGTPGIDVNAKTTVGSMTPLMIACAEGCGAMVEMLLYDNVLSEKLTVDSKDCYGMTAAMHAILARNYVAINALCRLPNTDLFADLKDVFGRSPLLLACEAVGIDKRNSMYSAGNVTSEEKDVLTVLWGRFSDRDFITSKDVMGWRFHHFAARHALSKALRKYINQFSLPGDHLLQPLPSKSQVLEITALRLAVWNARRSVRGASKMRRAIAEEAEYTKAIQEDEDTIGVVQHFLESSEDEILASEGPALDLVIDDLNPDIAFSLVRAGIVPSKNKGVKEKVLFLKALSDGRADAVHQMMLSSGYDEQIDTSVLRFVSGLRYFCCCTRHFISTFSDLPQLCYRVITTGEKRVDPFVVCGQCALSCWFDMADCDVEFMGIERGVCDCHTQMLLRGGFCVCSDHHDYPATEGINFPPKEFPVHVPKPRVRQEDLGFIQTPDGTDAETYLSTCDDSAMIPMDGLMSFKEYFACLVLHTGNIEAVAKVTADGLREDIKHMCPQRNYNTGFHRAAQFNCVDVLRLLRPPASIAPNRDGHSPLVVAVIEGHVAACRALWNLETMFCLDRDGFTPFHHAVIAGQSKVVKLFVSLLARVQDYGPVGELIDSLYLPCMSLGNEDGSSKSGGGDGAQVTLPLDTSRVATRAQTAAPGDVESHASPLHLAVRCGQVEIASILIRAGCQPFKRDSTHYHPFKTAMWEHYKARTLESLAIQAEDDIQAKRGSRERMLSRGQSWRQSNRHLIREGSHFNQLHFQDLQNTGDMLKEMLHRNQRVRKRVFDFAFIKFYHMSIIYLLMALAFLVFVVSTNSYRYTSFLYAQNNIVQSENFVALRNTTELWDYIEDRFTSPDDLFANAVDEDGGVTVGVIPIGSARIRQVRTGREATRCSIDNTVIRDTVYSRFHDYEVVTDGAWASTTNLSSFGEGATYQSNLGQQHELSGEFGSYPPGGYKVDLDRFNRTSNAAMLQSLRWGGWIDDKTRAVIVEFAYFNFNLDMMTSCQLLVEFASTGEMNCIPRIISHPLHSATRGSSTEDTYPSTSFTVLIMCVLAYLSLAELRDISQEGMRSYVTNIGNLYDLSVIGLMSYLLYETMRTDSLLNDIFPISADDWARGNSFFAISEVLEYKENNTLFIGGVLLLIVLRVLQYTIYLPYFGPVVRGLVNTVKDLRVIAFVALLIFVVFVFSYTLRIAASSIEETSEYPLSFVLVFVLLLGEYPEDEYLFSINEKATFVVVAVFVVLVSVMLMNMFISILSEIYPGEKRKAEGEYRDSIIELMEDNYVHQGNPLLEKVEFNWRPKRVAYNFVVRPFLELVAGFIGGIVFIVGMTCCRKDLSSRLARFHPNPNVGIQEFGWETGLSERVAKSRSANSRRSVGELFSGSGNNE